jgi:hypothetical protein
MAVRKPCSSRGCKASPRCEHPWWLDVMHSRQRYRMPVDDFALARGAKAPVTSKQEAEKVWEPKFIAEISLGKILGCRSNARRSSHDRRRWQTC